VSDVRLAWLTPTHASPHGVKPSGLRRAQARFCQGRTRCFGGAGMMQMPYVHAVLSHEAL
jgi:hypothetical protein